MKQYHQLLRWIAQDGCDKGDRTGTGTRSLFGPQMMFNLQHGFPLLTTKKVFLRGIIHELLWFLKGSTNIKYLVDNDVHIWNEWAYKKYLKDQDLDVPASDSDEWKEGMASYVSRIKEDLDFAQLHGELGPVYGSQWREVKGPWVGPGVHHYMKIDQIKNVVEALKKDPDGRRHIVSAWNPAEVDFMALPPCHCLFQFYSRVDNDTGERYLDCKLYQRSADVFLGVPFNIASYALLTMMIAKVTDHKPGRFIHSFGDVHIYNNHRDQVNEQLSREIRELPTMTIRDRGQYIDDFVYDDFVLEGYDPHPAIKAPVAV